MEVHCYECSSYAAGKYGGAEWSPFTLIMKCKFMRPLFKFDCSLKKRSLGGGPKGSVVDQNLVL